MAFAKCRMSHACRSRHESEKYGVNSKFWFPVYLTISPPHSMGVAMVSDEVEYNGSTVPLVDSE